MVAYNPQDWIELFGAVAGAAAALTGLLFVAVSLNIKDILESPGLPSLAFRCLVVLLSLLLLSIFVLVPGQPHIVFASEILILGFALVLFSVISVSRSHFPVVKWTWSFLTLTMSLFASVPLLLAGISLLAEFGGGLYWAVFELVTGFAVALYNAWVLLVEIKR